MTQPLVRLNPPALPDAGAMGYSQITIVEPGRLAFVSGQVAWRPGGEPAPEAFAAQAELVVHNVGKALDAVGASPADVVMMRAYVVDLTPERLEQLWPPVLAFLDGAQPSVTGIGVAALAAPDLLLEIELTVRLPT